jgi:group I intron endonuclease
MFNVKNLEDLLKSGVYRIINKTTGKFYIGSTIMSIQKRCYHHLSLLRANKHKNIYLQNSWNKYGEEDFLFEILEITDKNNTLIREQYWIDYYKENNQILFNINPLASGTPNMSKETILKRAKTLKRKYASGELTPIFKKGHIPWNKGKTKENIDYSYLKKPKTLTDNVLKSREKRIINNRESSFDIFVYDLNYNFLGKWRSSKDLEEWSLTENNNLPIKSRFKGERMGKPIKFLQSVNINKSCKFNRPYKGLLFSYKPLHQVIDVEKLDKFGETPEMDNTEPTTNLND